MKKNAANAALISQGKHNLDLAEKNMGALMALRARFKKSQPFKNIRIGMALHLTKETGVLIRTLTDGGAKVVATSCNPLSTQDDVVAALSSEGMELYGFKGESTKDYYHFLRKVVLSKPHITVDDGCDLVNELHTRYPEYIENIVGGCEETTTGVLRLKAMQKAHALKYPIIAVNDNKTKHLMDNYYGTGQSTIDGILRASNILFSGKTVVVAGYGSCGKGVALRAKGLGGNVIVTEIDPFCSLQAVMDGFRVMPMNQAAALGDIFVTVTGNCDIITPTHIRKMKSGAMIVNSGHFDIEIDMKGLKAMSSRITRIRPFLDEYRIKGNGNKYVYVAGEGRLVNLAAAEGHPSEVMSMSFCGQALAVDYILKNKQKLEPKVYQLPPEIDDQISRLQLQALHVKIDTLTARQKKYLAGWQEGT
ncbi:adenosylhomocysteinase [Candidatus Peregrinibacteria bacterium]|nr:adenosylhomocysteinase [Candidatus Peregrinibacteria bacterium]